ncbi:MAG: L-seryl-tRNA(Sec) selenium transferase [Chloroflexi bacterium]|nr:L-seryl-tRNA(Sec) selenium transferase [Chloroflexota bacterium]
MSTGFRALPSVERLLSQEPLQELARTYSHDALVGMIRQELAERRQAIAQGENPPSLDELVLALQGRLRRTWTVFPQPLINATGVILHTNLGRAPLSRAAIQAVTLAAGGYTGLEYDVAEGERGSRQAHVEALLRQLTGAEAGIALNNNASAVMLGLAAIAAGKEVIVSRGEAVEIGGGFRIPEVLAQSGATLVEVGTTNRTYAADYEKAITEHTGALLKVHASNFRVVGFTHTPATEELVALGRQRGVPVLHDLGSGCLLDTAQFGLAHEPTPQESINAGVDLAFFSGDKLLGGPQAGIAVGKQEAVQRMARHPLARAVRLDKLSLAALTATLLHYLKDEALREIPTWRMIALSPQVIHRRALRWRRAIGPRASVVKGESTVGAGSLPGETLPTWLVALDPAGGDGGADALAARLRSGDPPVIARIAEGQVVLDPRTLLPGEDAALVKICLEALREQETPGR